MWPLLLLLVPVVLVDLDGLVPGRGDDRQVFISIADEGDFCTLISTTLILAFASMAFQLVDHDAREKIKDLDLSDMAADDQFAMFLIQSHAGDVALKAVFETSGWLAILCVPNVD